MSVACKLAFRSFRIEFRNFEENENIGFNDLLNQMKSTLAILAAKMSSFFFFFVQVLDDRVRRSRTQRETRRPRPRDVPRRHEEVPPGSTIINSIFKKFFKNPIRSAVD